MILQRKLINLLIKTYEFTNTYKIINKKHMILQNLINLILITNYFIKTYNFMNKKHMIC